jgi:hypothetical protein
MSWPNFLQVLGAQLTVQTSLCLKCREFLDWELLRIGRLREDTFFYHHETGSALKSSGEAGCQLCRLIYYQLKSSRRPEQDTGDLPSRRIRISITYPSIHSGIHYLRVSIEPQDLKTAGLHDFSELDYNRVSRCVINNPTDELLVYIANTVRRSNFAVLEKLGHRALATAENSNTGSKVFFHGIECISEDEFFYLATPFYSSNICLWLVDRGKPPSKQPNILVF